PQQLSCSAVALGGEPGALLLEFREVEQRRRADRERRLLDSAKATRELVRNLAHEIRNPLGGLRGAAQLLERELPTPELREFTRIIISEADRLTALTEGLLGPVPHRSVGASTAVFAALGLLGSLGWAGRRHSVQGWIYRFGPIVAAVALLAYTGAGGERTDVGAHIWGFAAGLGAGWLAAFIPRAVLQRAVVQAFAGLAAVGALVAAWLLALA
ncbi:MAG TPA: rhomboid family intramembrane serine protease, partial [Gammaproteobacteria bacterium]|nr:rhomboid family intramembrane serine protease [Gammaproteobacteria bacterium]